MNVPDGASSAALRAEQTLRMMELKALSLARHLQQRENAKKAHSLQQLHTALPIQTTLTKETHSHVIPKKEAFKVPLVGTSQIQIPNTPRDFEVEAVATSPEWFRLFCAQWKGKEEFACSVMHSKLSKEKYKVLVPCDCPNFQVLEEDGYTFLPKLCLLHGLMICWSPEKVYFLELTQTGKDAVPFMDRLFRSCSSHLLFQVEFGLRSYAESKNIQNDVQHEDTAEDFALQWNPSLWAIVGPENLLLDYGT